jgi:hypothetical protein
MSASQFPGMCLADANDGYNGSIVVIMDHVLCSCSMKEVQIGPLVHAQAYIDSDCSRRITRGLGHSSCRTLLFSRCVCSKTIILHLLCRYREIERLIMPCDNII